MNIFQKILSWIGRDYVLLVFHDGKHKVRPVYWILDMPFSAPYLRDTSARLFKDGTLKGPEYLVGWLPATEKMEKYHASNTPPSN